jgi:prepilin-type N-terminal cleavage/methylation domain-containing protein
MKTQRLSDEKGITLIELLIVLVMSSVLIGGIYRLFVAQSKAYAVQEQVVEVQQGIRAAMELMLRDLRTTGFDDDRTPAILVTHPVIPEDHAITVRYEYEGAINDVHYSVDEQARLLRQETRNGVTRTESLLENTEAFDISYGIDQNEDGSMDDRNGNGIPDDWGSSASVGSSKVVSVRVSLRAVPAQVNPDLRNTSPRILISAVSFRNLSQVR